MKPAMTIRSLGKAFRQHPTRLDKLARFASFGRLGRESLNWVLRSISFEIAAGEAVGIIGRNGAGKSTLLKIIAGTTQATEGSIAVHGRVAALLELGMGFHTELTGRQNAVMAGNLMGLSTAEIQALMPEIEAFAEIGDYVDQPLRVYSSGMHVRLAFGVATALRPEILIVDEALAVGDIYFQQKCFRRLAAYRDAGTSLVFVTHDLPSVYRLCSRALYLDTGSLVLDATPKEVIDLYQANVLGASQRERGTLQVSSTPPDAVEPALTPSAGDRLPTVETSALPSAVGDSFPAGETAAIGSYSSPGVLIRSVRLLDERQEEATVFFGDRVMVIEVQAQFAMALPDPHVGFQIRDRSGQAIFMTTTAGLGRPVGAVGADECRIVRFELKPSLAPAQYTVTVGVANGARLDGSFEQGFVRYHDVAAFSIVESMDGIRWAGVANLNPRVTIAGGALRSESRRPK